MHEGSVLAGKYRLLSLLGRGGMGSVWRAEHMDLAAPVAVKLLDPFLAATGEGLARFHREAQAAAALRSPHVVQILDRGIDESSRLPFIVMELMEGESLAARIARSGQLSPELTCRVVSHVARALSRAHAAGIVHRDLKPDNVFLVRNEEEEVAKVLDFGIAKSEKHALGKDAHTRTGAVMGTAYYMSPEQISGAKGLDLRTDIWALGVIACECLTGRRPFDAETIGGITLKICVEPLPIPSELGSVPPSFDGWFARAVARDPAARFQSAREASDELRRACAVASPSADRSSDVAAEPSFEPQTASTSALVRSSPGEIPVTVPRRPVAWFMIAGVGVAVAAAGGAVWLSFHRATLQDQGASSASATAGSPNGGAVPAAMQPAPETDSLPEARPPSPDASSSASAGPASTPSASSAPAVGTAGGQRISKNQPKTTSPTPTQRPDKPADGGPKSIGTSLFPEGRR